MFVFYGWGSKNKIEEWCDGGICNNCGHNSGAHLMQNYKYISLFFIPVIKMSRKYFITCDECSAIKGISKEDHKTIQKEYYNRLKEGSFSKEMIIKEFSPENMKYGAKIAAFVFTMLSALVVSAALVSFLGSIKSFSELDTTSIVVVLFVAAIIILAILEGFQKFSVARAYKKLYDNAVNYNNSFKK